MVEHLAEDVTRPELQFCRAPDPAIDCPDTFQTSAAICIAPLDDIIPPDDECYIRRDDVNDAQNCPHNDILETFL